MPLKIGSSFPSLSGATNWLNTPVKFVDFIYTSLNPHLVYFWAKSCPSCKVNMPDLQLLRDRYAPMDLRTIAVHMPRGEFDIDADEVRAAIEELGITEPCAIDNDHKIGDRFDVKAWPTYYLFDKNGLLKRHAKGGFGVKMIEAALKDMFGD